MPRTASLSQPVRVSPLAGVFRPGRFGRSLETGPGTRFSLLHPARIVSLIVTAGQDDSLAAAVSKAYGADLPAMGRVVSARGVSFHANAPGQWLAVAHGAGDDGLSVQMQAKLAGLAQVVSQTHGRTVIAMSGPRARDVLQKATPVDLHPAAFGPGRCAATLIGHVGVLVSEVAPDSFELNCLRSFAESLYTGLAELALEWGYEAA